MSEFYTSPIVPTPGEVRYHEELVDSGTYLVEQEKTDIRRLAEVAARTQDQETKNVVLNRWNRLFPTERFTNFELFYGVEVNEYEDD